MNALKRFQLDLLIPLALLALTLTAFSGILSDYNGDNVRIGIERLILGR